MKHKESEIPNIPIGVNIRNIMVSLSASVILIYAFSRNKFIFKVIIMLFLICALAKLGESIASLLNKKRLYHIFRYIFCTSFFIYCFGFLIYTEYYSIVNKNYILIIMTIPFWLFGISFFKLAFFKGKNPIKNKYRKNKIRKGGKV